MIENTIRIRPASVDDAEAILAIYAPYIENTAISFEYDVPSARAFRLRIEKILSKFPFLAAIDTSCGDKIVGYAYANTFRERAAYGRSVELSIYIEPGYKGCGVGRRLYDGLEQILTKQNILNMIACITNSSDDAPQAGNNASVDFHRAMNFSVCGSITRCGFKFGKWYDTIYMEKYIGKHGSEPKPVLTFEQVRSIIDFSSM